MNTAITRKHLTTAQRIRVIEEYIKVTFSSDGDGTYMIPATHMPILAADATSMLGFVVNTKQLVGCFKVMQEMGLSVIRPPAAPKKKSARAILHERVDELEQRVTWLEAKMRLVRDV